MMRALFSLLGSIFNALSVESGPRRPFWSGPWFITVRSEIGGCPGPGPIHLCKSIRPVGSLQFTATSCSSILCSSPSSDPAPPPGSPSHLLRHLPSHSSTVQSFIHLSHSLSTCAGQVHGRPWGKEDAWIFIPVHKETVGAGRHVRMCGGCPWAPPPDLYSGWRLGRGRGDSRRECQSEFWRAGRGDRDRGDPAENIACSDGPSLGLMGVLGLMWEAVWRWRQGQGSAERQGPGHGDLVNPKEMLVASSGGSGLQG